MDDINSDDMQNPIFKLLASKTPALKIVDDITEKEIERYKKKLNDLTNNLINTQDVYFEFLMYNDIKKELENLFSVLNIKQKEIFNNTNMNNNNFFNAMFNPYFMNINPMQQQIPMQNFLNNVRNNEINVIFRKIDDNGNTFSIMVPCFADDKVDSVIDKYRNISGNKADIKQFIFNDKQLNSYLTMAEAGIGNFGNIFLYTPICVYFRDNYSGGGLPPIMVECLSFEKVSSIIERFRNKSGNRDENLKFVFNAKRLSPNLIIKDAGISHMANIFVFH